MTQTTVHQVFNALSAVAALAEYLDRANGLNEKILSMSNLLNGMTELRTVVDAFVREALLEEPVIASARERIQNFRALHESVNDGKAPQ